MSRRPGFSVLRSLALGFDVDQTLNVLAIQTAKNSKEMGRS